MRTRTVVISEAMTDALIRFAMRGETDPETIGSLLETGLLFERDWDGSYDVSERGERHLNAVGV